MLPTELIVLRFSIYNWKIKRKRTIAEFILEDGSVVRTEPLQVDYCIFYEKRVVTAIFCATFKIAISHCNGSKKQ